MTEFRFAVNVTPKPGILDPQGRAVEGSLGHLGIDGVSGVRVGRRVELTVEAAGEGQAREVVERLARELFSNPLIEAFEVEALASPVAGGAAGADTGERGAEEPGVAAPGTAR
jgi:phosphoribosylformylglycinamidine synthase